jgi:hypothetical protein
MHGTVLKLVAVLLCSQEVSPPPQGELPKADSSSFLEPLHGTLRMKYRYRATSGDSDSDLYEILTLTYGDPEKDRVSAALSARLAEDLDGNRNIQGFYPFTSLDDARRSFATQRLYTAYVDFHAAGREWSLRAGRQVLDEIPEAVSMDGALVRYQVHSRVTLSAFGGLPVNLYESSPSGDAMYGASAEWVPDPGRRARYRMEYLHIRDDNVFGLHKDDLIAWGIDDAVGPIQVHARYAMLEGESRDLVGRLTAAVPDAEFLFQFQGTYVFHRIEALSYALDPYASFLMELQPYLDLSVRASKSFGAVVSLDAAFTSRQLVRNGVETTYNHEFKRVEISPMARLDAFTVRASADYWNSPGNNFWTLSGDVSWSLHRDIVLSAGSSYALYSIDSFTGEERERVRTYSIGLKWSVSRGSSIDARFTLEDGSAGTFRVLEFGFRHAF